ncbi:hypothetical protein EDD16DRAFT_1519546 [Pisolithus croceorrhizus]|nr:hypothetical protein EDD16DRAFT_1519546 [Pisolithus croceorrhizus]KAI6160597.1 hypothetical protein EDD17DRAFT_1510248 [Pisolithus thermaeus]
MAQKMEISAPKWWSLLGMLLGDKETRESGVQRNDLGDEHAVMDMERNLNGYWDDVDEIDLEGLINELTGEQESSPLVGDRISRHCSRIKMMKANALQSLLDLFLQSVHTPYKVTDTLAHLGITISANTINMAIQALLLFPLAHGITLDDLKCLQELWGKLALNPQVDNPHTPHQHAWWDLLKSLLHPELLGSKLMLSHQDQFNAWMFLCDLCTYGPDYFHQFKSIPLVKMPIFAARAMDINNSTVSGNIEAVNALLRQGGIEDPVVMLEANYSSDVDLLDASQHVILIHGDLGTTAHEDETSLMCDIAQLWPKETGIYSTKLGFHHMHQLIGHTRTCRCLDCWRVHTETARGFDNLKSFALSKPKLDDLKRMADKVACTYVARHKLQQMHREQDNKQDLQFENTLLLNKYFLLYKELSYAMNHRDISHTETCIMSWIPILKATGKHKYATHMMNFLFNIHCIYPPGLRHAIHYHILINPTGHPAKWRAVDWCVELNNLFTKVKNGGKGSNWSVEQIITELPLVEVYHSLQASVQQNFGHTHLATNHLLPDMRKTYVKVQE